MKTTISLIAMLLLTAAVLAQEPSEARRAGADMIGALNGDLERFERGMRAIEARAQWITSMREASSLLRTPKPLLPSIRRPSASSWIGIINTKAEDAFSKSACSDSVLSLIKFLTTPKTERDMAAFIGLEDNQAPALCEHIRAKGIEISHDNWGKPTLVIKDLDGNELFFWLPENELASLESEMAERKAKPITPR